jgi:hypothetical protein
VDTEHQACSLQRAIHPLRLNTQGLKELQLELDVMDDQVMTPEWVQNNPSHLPHVEDGTLFAPTIDLYQPDLTATWIKCGPIPTVLDGSYRNTSFGEACCTGYMQRCSAGRMNSIKKPCTPS